MRKRGLLVLLVALAGYNAHAESRITAYVHGKHARIDSVRFSWTRTVSSEPDTLTVFIIPFDWSKVRWQKARDGECRYDQPPYRHVWFPK